MRHLSLALAGSLMLLALPAPSFAADVDAAVVAPHADRCAIRHARCMRWFPNSAARCDARAARCEARMARRYAWRAGHPRMRLFHREAVVAK